VPGAAPAINPPLGIVNASPTATGDAFCRASAFSVTPMYTLNPVATAGGFTG
jgi:hypothetical protein